jgi:Flp pilus assembly protein protease CpaA
MMLLLFKHHMTGGGDVKLNALILYAMPNASGVRILVLGMLSAAGYGIWKLWRRGLWMERIRHMRRFLEKNVHKEKYAYYLKERDGTDPAIPMAVFMLLAACLTVSAG